VPLAQARPAPDCLVRKAPAVQIAARAGIGFVLVKV